MILLLLWGEKRRGRRGQTHTFNNSTADGKRQRCTHALNRVDTKLRELTAAQSQSLSTKACDAVLEWY